MSSLAIVFSAQENRTIASAAFRITPNLQPDIKVMTVSNVPNRRNKATTT